MKIESLEIKYEVHSSVDDMEAGDKELIQEAILARSSSYAPYSNFNVGAALRLDDGTIVRGSNQENAAYPSCLCAERTAMFSAGANHPGKAIVSIAIAGGFDQTLSEGPCTPCGNCRQVMAEYQMKGGRPMSVIMYGTSRTLKFSKVEDIMPFIFDSFNEK